MTLEQRIGGYLSEALLLQVATSTDGVPWICTVCYASDANYNLYWMSRHETRHSREIAANSRVAGVVALPFSLGDKTRGLQIAGIAAELTADPEVSSGLAAMQRRYHVAPERVDQLRREILAAGANYGLYRLQPETIVLYDTLNFPDSPRQVFELPAST